MDQGEIMSVNPILAAIRQRAKLAEQRARVMVDSDGHTGVQFQVLHQARVTVTELEEANGRKLLVAHLPFQAHRRLEPVLSYCLFGRFDRCPVCLPERKCFYLVAQGEVQEVPVFAREVEELVAGLDVVWPEFERSWTDLSEIVARTGRRLPGFGALFEKAFLK